MTTDRRTLLKYGLASLAALQGSAGTRVRGAAAAPADEPISIDPNPGYRRIACEEAWTTAEIVAAQVEWADGSAAAAQPYVASMTRGFAGNRRFQEPRQELGLERIANMDRLGIQKQVLMLTAPGVQILEPDVGTALARDAPIYIHPTAPPAAIGEPYAWRGLEGALAGFSHEVWLHVMAIITSGAMDEFPNLKLCIGHMGEGMPLLMYRFDYMQTLAERPGTRGRPEGTRLERRISDYMKDNLYITTSGMAWAPAIQFCQQVLGVDHVLYAMDYPYQMDGFEVVATDTLPIPFEHKKKLFQTNAEQVFRL